MNSITSPLYTSLTYLKKILRHDYLCKKFVGDVRRKAPSNHNASLTLTEGEKDRGVSKKKKKNSDSRNQVSRKFWLMQQVFLPELAIGEVNILPKRVCLIALPCSVMAWNLPGECVPTVWRQQGTRRCTGGVSTLCSPQRRLEQHTVIVTRSEKLLITYCFKMLSGLFNSLLFC